MALSRAERIRKAPIIIVTHIYYTNTAVYSAHAPMLEISSDLIESDNKIVKYSDNLVAKNVVELIRFFNFWIPVWCVPLRKLSHW